MQRPFDSEDTTEHLADSKGSSLERMLRGWPEVTQLDGDEAWTRLISWMRRHGWTAAAGVNRGMAGGFAPGVG